MKGALRDCLVLDLSRLLPGPYCSMVLADHGARVIAIEDRRFEKGSLPVLKGVNRNKEHMALNLKSDRGRGIFFDLARRADVILEGFRPGVTGRLGVDYASVQAVNPRIVYCSLTGYGQTGPFRDRAGHDINFAGRGGALSLIGPADGPPTIPGVQLGDLSGALYAAIGILMALHERERTGEGQYIDVAMTDSVLSLLPYAAGMYWMTGQPPKRGDSDWSHRYAYYNIYRTRDGKYLAMAPLEPQFWQAVCHWFRRPDFIPLQHDLSRQGELIHFFRERFLEKDLAEWLAIFDEMDVCITEVAEVDAVLQGENAGEREMVVHLAEPDGTAHPFLGTPVKMGRTPGGVRTPPPAFGRDTTAILRELGYTDADIAALSHDGVI
jgi:crotonobetainyl-CoA:carnitine CoA-transferase CaiB-like acyl-CoA transferase